MFETLGKIDPHLCLKEQRSKFTSDELWPELYGIIIQEIYELQVVQIVGNCVGHAPSYESLGRVWVSPTLVSWIAIFHLYIYIYIWCVLFHMFDPCNLTQPSKIFVQLGSQDSIRQLALKWAWKTTLMEYSQEEKSERAHLLYKE